MDTNQQGVSTSIKIYDEATVIDGKEKRSGALLKGLTDSIL